ncbi:ATP12 family chaperone protein [uncultured Roseobacter sp.]|uniref:ATP12 family chaperone protein n=1 Tax=uncultured Roseobacter sp. TaxID=114847 RepID=UPI0026353463|nr:ATP12 family protein [uncultured Roseobacter sp.]
MSEWKAKRFWTFAEIVQQPDGFGVLLDARPVKTPAKQTLTVPTAAMAQAIADEWNAQQEQIDPRSMPFTRTANAAVDKVAVQHAEVAQMLAGYGDSDLLCYRAERPQSLVDRQNELWDPWLDWAADALGARLIPRSGVMHAAQAPEALAQLSSRVYGLTPFELAAFHDLVSLSGSLILGFGAAYGHRPAEEIWDISRLDENWQAEEWGKDDEAEAVAQIKRMDFLHAKQVFELVQG